VAARAASCRWSSVPDLYRSRGAGDLFRVNADAGARPVPGGAVLAGRHAGPCRLVRTGAEPGGAFLVPPAGHVPVPTLGLVRHPVDLAQPDRAAARGQPSTQPAPDVVQLCPRAAVW
jgi:hypothetical protein